MSRSIKQWTKDTLELTAMVAIVSLIAFLIDGVIVTSIIGVIEILK